MPSVAITFDATNGQRMLDASQYDPASGITMQDWIRQETIKMWKQRVIRYEAAKQITNFEVT